MSKDMLGSVIRAAVGVPQHRLDVLAKIASRMGECHPMGDVWHKHLNKLLLEGFGLVEADLSGIFHLTIDYSQSLEQMIAAGRYDRYNNITMKRFPIEGNGVVECEGCYFHFDRRISSETAIEEMKKTGWEPAKIEHVLSYGKTFPEEQRKFPIIGLGSAVMIDGGCDVPVLSEGGSERILYVPWFGYGWDPISRFLAVRKVSGS